MSDSVIQLTSPASSSILLTEQVTAALRISDQYTVIGGGGGSSTQRVYVQPTAPTFEDVGIWVDTSGGNLSIWIEDGL